MFGTASLKGDFTNKQNVYPANYLDKLSIGKLKRKLPRTAFNFLRTLISPLVPQRPVRESSIRDTPCPEHFQSYVFAGISKTIWQETTLLLADCNKTGIRTT